MIRFILMVFGLDHGADGDLNVDSPGIDDHHADSDVGFKLLSLQGITSFLLMFGLVGLALYRQNGLGVLIAISGALAAGMASVMAIAKIFSMVNKLQSSGTINIENAVGMQGKVYMTIPENGRGRVLVTVQNSLREYDAASFDNGTISSGAPIRVVWVDGNVLVVEPI